MSTWDELKNLTSARVALGRTGSSLPSKRVLEFQRAHALARSAVWHQWDLQSLFTHLSSQNEKPYILKTQVSDRDHYLRFPDRGRLLSNMDAANPTLAETDIVFCVSDGLSALAIEKHFFPFWQNFAPEFRQLFPEQKYTLVLVPFARVAIGDQIGHQAKAKMSIIFIGERPGLASPDSMGIYLTFAPQPGNSDAQRNCISNIREPLGLNYKIGAQKLIYLISESLRLQLSGVQLKDNLVIESQSEPLKTIK